MRKGIFPPRGGYKARLRKLVSQANDGFARDNAGVVKASEQAMAELAAGALDRGVDGIARQTARAWARTANRRLERAGF